MIGTIAVCIHFDSETQSQLRSTFNIGPSADALLVRYPWKTADTSYRLSVDGSWSCAAVCFNHSRHVYRSSRLKYVFFGTRGTDDLPVGISNLSSIVGFGLTFAINAAPLLITELAYPTQVCAAFRSVLALLTSHMYSEESSLLCITHHGTWEASHVSIWIVLFRRYFVNNISNLCSGLGVFRRL